MSLLAEAGTEASAFTSAPATADDRTAGLGMAAVRTTGAITLFLRLMTGAAMAFNGAADVTGMADTANRINCRDGGERGGSGCTEEEEEEKINKQHSQNVPNRWCEKRS